MFPENPEGTRVIEGSMNMGYVSTRTQTRAGADASRPQWQSLDYTKDPTWAYQSYNELDWEKKPFPSQEFGISVTLLCRLV